MADVSDLTRALTTMAIADLVNDPITGCIYHVVSMDPKRDFHHPYLNEIVMNLIVCLPACAVAEKILENPKTLTAVCEEKSGNYVISGPATVIALLTGNKTYVYNAEDGTKITLAISMAEARKRNRRSEDDYFWALATIGSREFGTTPEMVSKGVTPKLKTHGILVEEDRMKSNSNQTTGVANGKIHVPLQIPDLNTVCAYDIWEISKPIELSNGFAITLDWCKNFRDAFQICHGPCSRVLSSYPPVPDTKDAWCRCVENSGGGGSGKRKEAQASYMARAKARKNAGSSSTD